MLSSQSPDTSYGSSQWFSFNSFLSSRTSVFFFQGERNIRGYICCMGVFSPSPTPVLFGRNNT